MSVPILDRPTLDVVRPLVDAYLAEHPGGGSLHVVLNDGNLKRSHIRWCEQWARDHGDEPGALLASVLATLSMSQLRRLVRR